LAEKKRIWNQIVTIDGNQIKDEHCIRYLDARIALNEYASSAALAELGLDTEVYGAPFRTKNLGSFPVVETAPNRTHSLVDRVAALEATTWVAALQDLTSVASTHTLELAWHESQHTTYESVNAGTVVTQWEKSEDAGVVVSQHMVRRVNQTWQCEQARRNSPFPDSDLRVIEHNFEADSTLVLPTAVGTVGTVISRFTQGPTMARVTDATFDVKLSIPIEVTSAAGVPLHFYKPSTFALKGGVTPPNVIGLTFTPAPGVFSTPIGVTSFVPTGLTMRFVENLLDGTTTDVLICEVVARLTMSANLDTVLAVQDTVTGGFNTVKTYTAPNYHGLSGQWFIPQGTIGVTVNAVAAFAQIDHFTPPNPVIESTLVQPTSVTSIEARATAAEAEIAALIAADVNIITFAAQVAGRILQHEHNESATAGMQSQLAPPPHHNIWKAVSEAGHGDVLTTLLPLTLQFISREMTAPVDIWEDNILKPVSLGTIYKNRIDIEIGLLTGALKHTWTAAAQKGLGRLGLTAAQNAISRLSAVKTHHAASTITYYLKSLEIVPAGDVVFGYLQRIGVSTSFIMENNFLPAHGLVVIEDVADDGLSENLFIMSVGSIDTAAEMATNLIFKPETLYNMVQYVEVARTRLGVHLPWTNGVIASGTTASLQSYQNFIQQESEYHKIGVWPLACPPDLIRPFLNAMVAHDTAYSLFTHNCQHKSKELINFLLRGVEPHWMTTGIRERLALEYVNAKAPFAEQLALTSAIQDAIDFYDGST
jgi:hypothetical protein